MRNLIFIFALLELSATALFSQIKISAELRPRFEFRNGYKAPRDSGETPAFFVSQRTRVNFNYEKDKLRSAISLQDTRVWGDEQLKTTTPRLGIHEAWAEYLFNDKVSLKMGRQEIFYENKRLLSDNNWNQAAQSHDGIYLKYYPSSWKFDLGGAWNQAAELSSGFDYSDLNKKNYICMSFLGISKKIKEKITVSSLTITDGYQKEGTTDLIYMRYTTGLIFSFKSDVLEAAARGFYQGGKSKNGTDISAFYLNPEVKYKMFTDLNVKFGMEYISGTDVTNTDGKDHAFDILYGTGHSFNGTMDYYGKPSNTKNAGLKDIFFTFIYTPDEKSEFSMDYHNFSITNDYLKDTIVIDKYLGSEVDFIYKRKVNDAISIDAGYGIMFGTKSGEILNGGNYKLVNHFGYIMLIFKPVFFDSKALKP